MDDDTPKIHEVPYFTRVSSKDVSEVVVWRNPGTGPWTSVFRGDFVEVISVVGAGDNRWAHINYGPDGRFVGWIRPEFLDSEQEKDNPWWTQKSRYAWISGTDDET